MGLENRVTHKKIQFLIFFYTKKFNFFDDTHRARWLTVLCRAKRSAMVAPCGHVLGRSVAQTECLLTLAPSCENLILPPARSLILAA